MGAASAQEGARMLMASASPGPRHPSSLPTGRLSHSPCVWSGLWMGGRVLKVVSLLPGHSRPPLPPDKLWAVREAGPRVEARPCLARLGCGAAVRTGLQLPEGFRVHCPCGPMAGRAAHLCGWAQTGRAVYRRREGGGGWCWAGPESLPPHGTHPLVRARQDLTRECQLGHSDTHPPPPASQGLPRPLLWAWRAF